MDPKLCLELTELKGLQVICKEGKHLHHTCARFHYWVDFWSSSSCYLQDFPADKFITRTKVMMLYGEADEPREQNNH